ncbi:MAG: F0F1 ATP synthase subunit delta [Gammaproteobacteria bacterium]|nr:F0F1 ATP synthase subunit delta [Gammaproteobacteria bacterium]MYD76463.1 F0F1 ATP synthase subunit delta [Gammaproteobacteria bacterium]MYJ52847.1 F0F1 ATP synthase subunit delta [Gammaproteobacteria bacterium]
MPSQSNIARPYAQALFQLAQEQDNLAGWHEQLQLLATVAEDTRLQELAANPRISSSRLTGLILDVCDGSLDEFGRNLVNLIVQNGRLSAMADIAEAYAACRAEAERTVNATMITAAPIDKGQQDSFSRALREKLGRTVELEFEVDEALIGGAVIRAGDWVVDGSVKAQLERLVGVIGS